MNPEPPKKLHWKHELLALLLPLTAVKVPALAVVAAFTNPGTFETLGKQFRQSLERDHWGYLLFVLAIPLAMFWSGQYPPGDDLLRDLVAYQVNYDYRGAYWGSPGVPPYNQYIAFDWAVSALGGQPYAPPLVQSFLFVAFAAAFLRAVRLGLGDGARYTVIAALLLLTLALPTVLCRVVMARPEMLFCAWLLWGLSARRGAETWFWASTGSALALCYWLSPIYASAALALGAMRPDRLPLRIRLGLGAFLFLCFSAQWLIATDGVWLRAIPELYAQMSNRAVDVVENQLAITALATMMGPLALIVLVLAIRATRARQARWEVMALAAFFLLPNMVRYAAHVEPLLVLAALPRLSPRLHNLPLRWWPALHVAIVWGALMILPPSAPSLPMSRDLLVDARPGDRVLTPFGAITYQTLFNSLKHGVLIAPALEIGMTDKAVQVMARELNDGKVDCAQLAQWHVQWVVEKTLSQQLPHCLSLHAIDGPVRLWRVQQGAP